jgi:hypothetical protein
LPALTQAYENYEKPGLVVSYKMSNTKIFKGAMVAVNTSGFVIPVAHGTASLKFIGIANETVDNSGGTAGDRSISITKGGSFVMKAISGYTPAQADIGKEVYANTDWEIQVSTSGLTNQYKVGVITAVESTSTGAAGVRIRIANYVS